MCREPFAAKDVDEALTQYIERAEQLRSAGAMANHERSKKHAEAVAILRAVLRDCR